MYRSLVSWPQSHFSTLSEQQCWIHNIRFWFIAALTETDTYSTVIQSPEPYPFSVYLPSDCNSITFSLLATHKPQTHTVDCTHPEKQLQKLSSLSIIVQERAFSSITMTDVEGVPIQRQQQQQPSVANPYAANNHNHPIPPQKQFINKVQRILYIVVSAYGLHYFKFYRVILRSPHVRHEWFKVGLALSIGAYVYCPAYEL